MLFKILKMSRILLLMSIIGFAFIWLGCPTQINSNPPPSKISPPRLPKLVLKAQAGGGASEAIVSWLPSNDTGRTTFSGYRVFVYEVDANGKIINNLSAQLVGKTQLSYTVDNLVKGTRYLTSIRAELNDQNNTTSDTVNTPIYGAVYYNTNGQIDEFNANSESGYGWPFGPGSGYQYSYTAQFANSIDLHLRNVGSLTFYSPKIYPPGLKITKMEYVGLDSSAFNNTSLQEPDKDSVSSVNVRNVYLLKTSTNYYIKVFVRTIDNSVSANYKTLYFDYKIQSVPGVRVL